MKKKTVKKTIKKKMSKETLVNFVLDETGSMSSCREATISGFNEYISELKKRKEKILFSLTKFDSLKIDKVYIVENIDKIKPLNQDTYVPGAMTPLYDAIASTIKSTEEKIKNKKVAVLTVIMTDGEENASKEYTREKIFNLIKEKEKEGWTFVYLGANQDAWAIGQSIGLQKGNTMSYDITKTVKTFRGLTANTCNYFSDGSIQTTMFCKDKSGEDKIRS